MKPRKPWPFSETLAPKVCWYRATHQMQFPSVVAESVVAREHPAGRCPDFLWRFQFALGHSLLERFEFLLHFLHRLFSLSALVLQAFLTVDHKNPYSRFTGGDLLHQSLRHL